MAFLNLSKKKSLLLLGTSLNVEAIYSALRILNILWFSGLFLIHSIVFLFSIESKSFFKYLNNCFLFIIKNRTVIYMTYLLNGIPLVKNAFFIKRFIKRGEIREVILVNALVLLLYASQ